MSVEPLQLHLAENLLTLLCYSGEHGRLLATQLEPPLFDNEIHRTIATRAIGYWRRYGKAPGKAHTADLVADIWGDRNHAQAGIYRDFLRSMVILYDQGINAEYALDELASFRRLHAFKHAIMESAEQLQNRQQLALPEVEKLWANVLRTRPVDFDPGLRLDDHAAVIGYLERREQEFSIGIKPLDDRGIIPAREAVMLLLAPPGAGKSWFLIAVGRRAFRDGKKVLHITLELSERMVLARYYQTLFGVPRRALELKSTLLRKRDGEYRGVRQVEARPKFHLRSKNLVRKLRANLNPFGLRTENLLIKQFPARWLTIDRLRAYLDGLAHIDRFEPDLILIDYFGLVHTDARDHRIQLGRQFEDFRGLTAERNIAGITVHQVNRKGALARFVSATHVAEDYSLIATADVAMTYSTTAGERKLKLARLWVEKAREEEDKFGVVISQNYHLGQFALDAAFMNPRYQQQFELQEQAERQQEREQEDDDADDALD